MSVRPLVRAMFVRNLRLYAISIYPLGDRPLLTAFYGRVHISMLFSVVVVLVELLMLLSLYLLLLFLLLGVAVVMVVFIVNVVLVFFFLFFFVFCFLFFKFVVCFVLVVLSSFSSLSHVSGESLLNDGAAIFLFEMFAEYEGQVEDPIGSEKYHYDAAQVRGSGYRF